MRLAFPHTYILLTWEWRSSFPRNLLCFLTEIVRRYSGLICWPCSRNLGLKQTNVIITTDQRFEKVQTKPDRLLNKCVKTHKKRHLLLFLSHCGSFLFEAVILVCIFHIMADSDTQICLRYLCCLQPSPGGRRRRHHLNSSSHWHTPSTFLSCRAAAKNKLKIIQAITKFSSS